MLALFLSSRSLKQFALRIPTVGPHYRQWGIGSGEWESFPHSRIWGLGEWFPVAARTLDQRKTSRCSALESVCRLLPPDDVDGDYCPDIPTQVTRDGEVEYKEFPNCHEVSSVWPTKICRTQITSSVFFLFSMFTCTNANVSNEPCKQLRYYEQGWNHLDRRAKPVLTPEAGVNYLYLMRLLPQSPLLCPIRRQENLESNPGQFGAKVFLFYLYTFSPTRNATHSVNTSS